MSIYYLGFCGSGVSELFRCLCLIITHKFSIGVLAVAAISSESLPEVKSISNHCHSRGPCQASFPHELLDRSSHVLSGCCLEASLSSFLCGTLHESNHKIAAGATQNEQRVKVCRLDLFNLILEVTCYYFCCILYWKWVIGSNPHSGIRDYTRVLRWRCGDHWGSFWRSPITSCHLML